MSRNQHREICAALNELSEQLSHGRDVLGAMARLEKLDEQLREAGRESGYVAWQLGIACDLLDRHGEALDHITRAIRIDPAVPGYLRSRALVVNRVRSKLDELRVFPGNPMIAVLCLVLAENGEHDRDSMVQLLRYNLAADKLEQACELVIAFLNWHPFDLEMCHLHVEVAKRTGDPEMIACARRMLANRERNTEIPAQLEEAKGLTN